MDFLNNYKIIYKRNNYNFSYYILEDINKNKYFAKYVINNSESAKICIRNEKEKYAYLNQYDFIPKLIECGSSYDYIIYEYIDGVILDDIDGLTLSELISIFIQICNCVEKIHQNNLVHCDLKMSNIMIKNSQVYIIDFGNCCFIGDIADYGSMVYCSVDQLLKYPVNISFDFYSLAVILYKLTTGKLPYTKKNVKILIEEKQQDFPLITNYILNYPTELDSIIYKLIHYKYKNISETIVDLKQIIK